MKLCKAHAVEIFFKVFYFPDFSSACYDNSNTGSGLLEALPYTYFLNKYAPALFCFVLFNLDICCHFRFLCFLVCVFKNSYKFNIQNIELMKTLTVEKLSVRSLLQLNLPSGIANVINKRLLSSKVQIICRVCRQVQDSEN